MKCLICGIELKFLGKHLLKNHALTQKEYYDSYIKQPNEGFCLTCGKELTFIKLSKGYGEFCSTKCMANNTKIKQQKEKTFLERYGVSTNLTTEVMKEKRRSSIKKRQQTSKKNNLTLYGVENIFQRQDVIDKIQQKKKQDHEEFERLHNCTQVAKLIKQYGPGWNLNKNFIIPKIYSQHVAYVDNKYIPQIEHYVESHKKYSTSYQEELIATTIQKHYQGKVIQHKRKIIPPLELDFYLPDIKLAIEFNGTYWHSFEKQHNKEYHLQKSIACREKGIRLIHIYQFEDFNEQLSLLGQLLDGKDNYPTKDFNKNNISLPIPTAQIIYKQKYTVYGAGPLLR